MFGKGPSGPDLVQAILYLTKREGYPPSIRELAEAFNVSVSTIHYHLGPLREDGVVAWETGRNRTLRVLV